MTAMRHGFPTVLEYEHFLIVGQGHARLVSGLNSLSLFLYIYIVIFFCAVIPNTLYKSKTMDQGHLWDKFCASHTLVVRPFQSLHVLPCRTTVSSAFTIASFFHDCVSGQSSDFR